MKTAIYIPDDIFTAIEKVIGRLKISRSEFFTEAAKEYIDNLESANITEQLDAVYSEVDSHIDRNVMEAQMNILGNEEW